MNDYEIEDYIKKYGSSYSKDAIVKQLTSSGADKENVLSIYSRVVDGSDKGGKSHAGLILTFGLLSFLPGLGIIFSIVAIVFFAKEKNRGGMAITGLVFAILFGVGQVFILPMAIAAGVLIQTASSLQSQSLDVGRQSQEKITTDIEVVQIYAWDTSDGVINGGEDGYVAVVRLGSGSVPIKWSNLLIKVDTMDGSQSMMPVSDNGVGVATFENYNVTYLSAGGIGVTEGYLSSTDLVEIEFVGEYDLDSGETATIRFMTKNGAVKPVTITTPTLMSQVTTYLYP